jgi:long-chain acyl-CoA synthetase
METIASLLRSSFAAHPRQQIVDGSGSLDFDGFDALSGSVARALQGSGLVPGDRVAVVATNSIACGATLVGAWKAGLVPVPINATFTVPELAYILGHAAPRAVMADAGKLADARAALGEAAGTIAVWLTDVAEPDGGATAVSALPPAAERWPVVDYPDLLVLLYTSGTTGRPKGVMLTQDNLLFMIDTWRRVAQTTPDDVMLCALPLFHVYPLVLLFLSGLAAGHALVLEKGFKFPRLLELLTKHRVTFFPAVPPVHQALATLPWDRARYDFSSLRLVMSGGAPLASATVDAVRGLLGDPPFYDGYGITETSPLISFGPLGTAQPPGSSGKPLPGVQVEIRDEAGRPLPVGEIGEIWTKSRGVMKGYYNDPTATAAVVIDGWYRSGDIGRLDEAGFLYVCDRVKDMIIVNGENVYPREVEAALLEYPGVARAAVARMTTSDSGEAPVAFIVPTADTSIAIRDLLGFLRERLAPFKLPRKFEIVAEIPTSPSGKILKRLLPTTKDATTDTSKGE